MVLWSSNLPAFLQSISILGCCLKNRRNISKILTFKQKYLGIEFAMSEEGSITSSIESKRKVSPEPATKENSFLHHLYIVFWRIFKYRQHHKFLTLCEIAFPILCFWTLIYYDEYFPTKTDGVLKQLELRELWKKFPKRTYVYYKPANNSHKKLMESVAKKLNLTHGERKFGLTWSDVSNCRLPGNCRINWKPNF